MRVLDRLRRLFRKQDDSAAVIAALASSVTALTRRVDQFHELHQDLIRQVGLHKSDADKQLSDLRTIVRSIREEAKKQPAAARSMAQVRAFMGDEEV